MTATKNFFKRIINKATGRNKNTQERPVDLKSIQIWLVSNLSAHLEIDPREISLQESFTEQGLDSLGMIRFSGEIEAWIKLEVDPTLLYDYLNIETLASHLAMKLCLPAE